MKKLLNFAALHITEECAHHCPYCYAGKGLGGKSQADFDTLCKILTELNKYGIKTVALLGGDPAKYNKIYDLLKFIKDETAIDVELLSNTLSVDGHSSAEIAPLVSCVETTIHGLSDFHDSLCGYPGAFKSIVSKLHEFHALNVPIDIDINIIPQNVTQIYGVLEHLFREEKLIIKSVLIQRIIPFGRAEGKNDYKLTREQLNSAFEQIDLAKKEFGFEIVAEDTFPYCALEEKYHKYLGSCSWGVTKFAINGEGRISRCGADPRYSIGNVLEAPLPDIWEKSSEIKKFHAKSFLSEKCKKCKHVSQCGGGCPLSSFLPNGELGEDYLSK